MSRLLPLAAAVAVVTTAGAAQAQSTSSTIRIEPRPYYGATVTLEQGVRVWRPLPPVKQVIVNPGGRTPLNLSFAEVNERSTSHNYYYNEGADGPDAPVGVPGYGYYPGRFGPFIGRPLQRHNAHRMHGAPHHGGIGPRPAPRSP